jgi:DNA-binding NarL/FixJ family response regulator
MTVSGARSFEQRQQRPLDVLLVVRDGAEGDGLAGVLRSCAPHVRVVERTSSESRAMQLFFALNPDITLLDWRVAQDEPARLVGLLKRVAPGARVVTLVPGVDSVPAHAARALGAEAVVCSDDVGRFFTELSATPEV